MNRLTYSVNATDLLERGAMEQPQELRRLFHQLNNQLGIILAHAELMETKAADETSRSRATQVVSSVLDAMGTAKEIRMQMGNRAPEA
jgi:C4-dicarboxylate-specific signal transduction histidine kinase